MKAAQYSRLLGGSGVPNGDGWYRALCPAHPDNSPSLALKDGRRGTILKCFAGCTTALIAVKLGELIASGALPPAGPIPSQPACAPGDSLQWALRIWMASTAISGTVAEAYLRFRGITMALPTMLRCHARLFHKDTGTHHPALVALVVGADGKPLGIQRTWLAADGRGKAAVEPARMSLGSIRGGAVRLGDDASGALIVAEGVETAFSASVMFGVPTVWATLSTSGLRNVIIPPRFVEVVIAADNDADGAGLAAAEALRRRLLFQVRKVRVVQPKEVGTDFNNVLQSKGIAV